MVLFLVSTLTLIKETKNLLTVIQNIFILSVQEYKINNDLI